MEKNRKQIKEVDIEFMTDTSAAMLMGIPLRYHLILITAVIFLSFAIIWANFAVLDVVTSGEGKVIPSSQIQTVQNLEGGIVKDIRVRVGNVVERNQILMIIDDTRFSSSFKENQIQLAALEAKLARLTAESRGETLEMPEVILKEYPEVARAEKKLYEKRLEELEVKLDILLDQKSQREQELLELQSHREQLERSYDLINKELTLTRPLVSQGAVSQVELLRLERSVNDIAGELEGTKLSIPRLEASVKGASSKIQEQKLTFQAEALAELNTVKAEYDRLNETLKAAEDRVNRTIVRSPVKGTINQVYMSTIGGIIQPGEDLVDIVPLEDTLLIEANIRPSDIGFLHPGLPAVVKITAYDFSIYGGLKASLEHISADTITNERGESFYQIRVRTEEDSQLKKGDKVLPIIPGMGATVDILTGQKTVLDYLLKPILKAKQNAMREP